MMMAIATHIVSTEAHRDDTAAPWGARDEQDQPTRDCPICGGDGFLIGDDDAEVQCDTCDGSGRVPRASQAA